MDENPVLVEKREGYRVITLNRPQRLNAFNEPMQKALVAAVAEAETDENCRALLLTGVVPHPLRSVLVTLGACVLLVLSWLCARVTLRAGIELVNE